MSENHTSIDIGAIRARLAEKSGPEYWRSLEELAGTPEFQEYVEHEFPQTGTDWREPLDRRNWLRLMGASLGLAGLTACTRQPLEKIVPYVKPPEEFSANLPVEFATASVVGGYANGVLIESHQGRPTKAEGNPQHPASRGATDVFAQAQLLGLYDPDRSQVVVREGRASSPMSFWAALTVLREQHLAKKGAGLRILSETITSPTELALMQALLAEMPEAKWHVWDPATADGARTGAQLAFGQPASSYYDVKAANVIVSLDADFLYEGPGAVRYALDFAARRKPEEGKRVMSRLYAVEVSPTPSSTLADHRLPVRGSEVEGFARALAAKLGVAVDAPNASVHEKWVNAIAKDLEAQKGTSLVIPGGSQPGIVHALAHAINEKLGNTGKTVFHCESFEGNPGSHIESLKQLTDAMKAGSVESLVVLGGNPVYSAPSDLGFSEAYLKVKNRVHLGLYYDETGVVSNWHLPQAHSLESWGDARAYDGTVTMIQPLIEPLYGGKTVIEVLAALGGGQGTNHNIWKRNWRVRVNAPDFEVQLQKALHDGLWAGTAPAPKNFPVKGDLKGVAATAAPSGLEITFRPDPTILDGRFANNGWLQELPKPASKLTWDNAVYIAPSTAEKLGVTSNDVVTLKVRGKSVDGVVWVQPGQARESVTVHLGYGRTKAGKVGNGAGFNANAIRSSAAPFADSVEVVKTGQTNKLASTQTHYGFQGTRDADVEAAKRQIVRVGTEEEFVKKADFAKELWEKPHPALTLYPDYDYSKQYAWGMVIDLNACNGCGACTIACVAENNIAVVGKDEVSRGREMHWIRVDRYHKGDIDNPSAYSQPLTCMHCENAPCETVCPVAATTHSEDGINQMVYNRCVGTRYCSNNCPYKVRRFNWYLYSDWDTPSLQGVRNPDVTVRSRGVMEKCTFCVQRINHAKIEAEKEDRRVKDGDIVTACQQVCPTQAITFGDLNDKSSQVAKWKADPRNYGVLEDLNTKPRVTYLARIENPNPELGKG